MAGVRIEEKIIPPFILISLALKIFCLCCKNWLEGYYGDVSVTQISPWFLCNVECLQCTSTKPHISCFWMDDWADTGLDILGVIHYLEFWGLGALILSFIPSLLLCMDNTCMIKHCGFDIKRPMLIMITVASLLSTLSVALFSINLQADLSNISNYKDLGTHYGSPYLIRITGTMTTLVALVITIVQECRLKYKSDGEIEEDKYMIVTHSETIEDVLEDENEENGDYL